MNRISQGRCLARTFLGLAVVGLFAASGCGARKGSVSGVVKFNGQPLPSGTIFFLSKATQQVVSAKIDDGKYSIPDLPAGMSQVSVTTTPPTTPGRLPGNRQAPASTAPGKYVPIPQKYANPETSGLSFEVKGGQQTKDFDLAS
jgi:hypothetical protein